MVYLGSATRKVLLGAAQYLLSNADWVTVYLPSTTIKEQLCAVLLCAVQCLLPNTCRVMVYLNSSPIKELLCALCGSLFVT
jgi:hypothetical protein